MHFRDKVDLRRAFGTPALSFEDCQLLYVRSKDKNNATFIRDDKWFSKHRNQRRYIRPAIANEFGVQGEGVVLGGQRTVPPRLWVCVEKRLCGEHHVVQPVMRTNTPWWERDKHDNMTANFAIDDDGNVACDLLLAQFHDMRGVRNGEIMAHAAVVVDASNFPYEAEESRVN